MQSDYYTEPMQVQRLASGILRLIGGQLRNVMTRSLAVVGIAFFSASLGSIGEEPARPEPQNIVPGFCEWNRNLWVAIALADEVRVEGVKINRPQLIALKAALKALLNDTAPKWDNYGYVPVPDSSRLAQFEFKVPRPGYTITFDLGTNGNDGLRIMPIGETIGSILPNNMKEQVTLIRKLIEDGKKGSGKTN